jgi:hypothetical protein
VLTLLSPQFAHSLPPLTFLLGNDILPLYSSSKAQ